MIWVCMNIALVLAAFAAIRGDTYWMITNVGVAVMAFGIGATEGAVELLLVWVGVAMVWWNLWRKWKRSPV